ncbi:MAG: hypothetical protein ABSE08_03390 [Syntrophobacteraceae bacterium]
MREDIPHRTSGGKDRALGDGVNASMQSSQGALLNGCRDFFQRGTMLMKKEAPTLSEGPAVTASACMDGPYSLSKITPSLSTRRYSWQVPGPMSARYNM